MLIFNIFFPVITGSNHGVGECDHIIKRTNDCQRFSYLVISTKRPFSHLVISTKR